MNKNYSPLLSPFYFWLSGTAIVFACVFLIEAGIHGYAYLQARYSHHSAYFDYEYVRPQRFEYKLGERPRFISMSVWRKATTPRWTDVLFCDTNQDGQYVRIGESVTGGGEIVRKRPWRESRPWPYVGELPTQPGTCYLESSIKVDVGYSQTKTLKINIAGSAYKFRYVPK